jgi:hypothetical protein
MSRPFRYEDQLIGMINHKLEAKFFFCFILKVQSTAFFQKVSLQTALTISSIFDFSLGMVIFLLFFRILELKDHEFFFIENVFLILGMFFGLISLDAANNLNKRNIKVYKLWRVYITFFIPSAELLNNSQGFCYYCNSCSLWYFTLMTTIWFFINFYFMVIAWSFLIRLEKGQELLIIHGRHLNKIIAGENNKLTDFGKFTHLSFNNETNFSREKEIRRSSNLNLHKYTILKDDN